jgi:hypothetical protein
MRAFLLAAPLALGLGLFATSSSMAVPASGTAILDASANTTVLEQVRWWGWRRHHCWHGWRSYRHCR